MELQLPDRGELMRKGDLDALFCFCGCKIFFFKLVVFTDSSILFLPVFILSMQGIPGDWPATADEPAQIGISNVGRTESMFKVQHF